MKTVFLVQRLLQMVLATCFLFPLLSIAQQKDFILSGSPDDTDPIVVDDEIVVSLNGAVIFTGATAGNYPPVKFKAKTGDKLRVRATDTVGICRSLSPLYLHVAGAPPRVLDKSGFAQVCDRPAGAPRLTFYDKTFPVVVGVGVVESISGFTGCPPAGAKMARWGRFGVAASVSSDAGETLQLRCVAAAIPYFEFLYTPPGAAGPFRVGVCPYHRGCNTGWFAHTGDADANGKPDSFVSTFWISREYGNHHAGRPDPFSGDAEPTPVLDWALTFMDAVTQTLTKADYKFEYGVGPPVPAGACSLPPMPQPEARFISRKAVDPPLGPVTESFFDQAIAELQADPSSDLPMESSGFSLADLNADGSKDSRDFSAFLGTYGACSSDSRFNPRADLDGDGCVTLLDYQVWYQLFTASP